MKRETLKDVVLTGLFILCIILSSRTFMVSKATNDSSEDKFALSEKSDVYSIFNPQSYSIGFGGSLHTEVLDRQEQTELWRIVLDILDSSGRKNKLSRLKASEWNDVTSSRGLTVQLPKGIYFNHVMNISGRDSDIDIQIDRIIFEMSDSTSIYLGGKDNSGFYRLGLERESDVPDDGFQKLREYIDNTSKNGFVEYRTIENIFSLNVLLNSKNDDGYVANSVVAPILKIDDIMPIETKNEFEKTDIVEEKTNILDNRLRKIASLLFGGDLSFVKTLKDIDDSVLYIYGYGQMTMKHSQNGVLEFVSAESNQDSTLNKKPDFSNSLRLAGGIISQFYDDLTKFRLESYRESSVRGNYFEEFQFQYEFDGMTGVVGDKKINDPILRVLLKNGRIIKFTAMPLEKKTSHYVDNKPTSFEEVVIQNIKSIGDTISPIGESQKAKSEDYYYNVINKITDVKLEYYIVDGSRGQNTFSELAVPVWEISIGKRTFIFSYYTGNHLKTITEMEDGLEQD